MAKKPSHKPKPLSNLRLWLIALIFAGLGFLGAQTMIKKPSPSVQQACPASVCVGLGAQGAVPATVTVKVGESVQFNSADGKRHNLSLGLGGEEHQHTGQYSSGDFQADEGWQVAFKQAGTFKFHDHFNPKINILVVAYEPGKDFKIQ